MRLVMARIVGIVLMLAAIWYGVSVYNGEMAEAPAEPTVTGTSERAFGEPPPATGRAAPTAVTSRVRERVSSAVAEGTSRHTGE